jgi:hypothetical protein
MGDNGGKAFTLGVDWPGRPLPMMPAFLMKCLHSPPR